MRIKLITLATACLLLPYLADSLLVDQCNSTSKEFFFRCTQIPQCISLTRACDMVIDCEDGSDELDCQYMHENRECPPDMFRCSVERCVRQSQMCDGIRDCPFGDDERRCGFPGPVWDCSRLMCTHGCESINGTDSCICPEDMFLDPEDPMSCLEKEPCKGKPCEHGCQVNEEYEYQCTCDEGYELSSDEHSCLPHPGRDLSTPSERRDYSRGEIVILILILILLGLFLASLLYCRLGKSRRPFRNLFKSIREKFSIGFHGGEAKITSSTVTFQESI